MKTFALLLSKAKFGSLMEDVTIGDGGRKEKVGKPIRVGKGLNKSV